MSKLKEVEKRYQELWSDAKEDWNGEQIENDISYLLCLVKRYREAIEKHRDTLFKWTRYDEELYKVLEEK